MQRNERMLFFIIVLLPLIDMATGWTASLPISFGIVLRMIVLLLLFGYFLRHFQWRYLPFVFALVGVGVSFIINAMMKNPYYFFTEVQFVFKTIYFIMMIYVVTLFTYRKEVPLIEANDKGMSGAYKTILRASKFIAFIMGIAYWLAIATGTSFPSYPYGNVGQSGWFFAANELSVIVLIVLTLTLIHLYKEKSASAFVAVAIMLTMMPKIGTKTAYYGALLIVLFFIFAHLLSRTRTWVPAIVGFATFCIFIAPTITSPLTHFQTEPIYEEIKTEKVTTNHLLSSRDTYLKNTRRQFSKAPLIRKLFGLGYGGNYTIAPKTIEMDFHDLFFSYGYIGTVFVIIPIFFLWFAFRRTKQRRHVDSQSVLLKRRWHSLRKGELQQVVSDEDGLALTKDRLKQLTSDEDELALTENRLKQVNSNEDGLALTENRLKQVNSNEDGQDHTLNNNQPMKRQDIHLHSQNEQQTVSKKQNKHEQATDVPYMASKESRTKEQLKKHLSKKRPAIFQATIKRFFRSPTYALLLFTLSLCGAIALVAGHVLFAPAVMSYVAILLIVMHFESISSM